MKKVFKFIYLFLIIGLESLGNMSAVTAVLEENLIKKNKLVTQEDLVDAITLSRLGPGATTVNVVAFLGNKIAGFWGGVLASICYVIAPLFVILAISGVIDKLIGYREVMSALRGSLVCICILFVKSSFDMGKSVLVNWFNILVFVVGLVVVILFDVSCVWIAVGAAFVGSVRVILQSY
jgi:chromate transporter